MLISTHINHATASLLNMTREMYRKNIEIARITKTCTLLLMSGVSVSAIEPAIIKKCLSSQNSDGGFVGNTDTIWNIKLLEYFPEFSDKRATALRWLKADNGFEAGFGRSKRDMHRIPTTGLALYLLPELYSDERTLKWLEKTWNSEKNSLTYKAAYTLLAFSKSYYKPKDESILKETEDWLISQQEESGGFAPWLQHPVGENVYCTAIATLGLMTAGQKSYEAVKKAQNYLCATQLKSGIWPYHEIEDGSAWGLLALVKSELFLEKQNENIAGVSKT